MTKSFNFVLGIIVFLFVTTGIAAFYTEPKSPVYPDELNYVDGGSANYTAEQKVINEKYQAEQKDFSDKDKIYSLNVSIISLGIGLILFLVCFIFIQSLPFLSVALQTGGMATIFYGIIRGFMSENVKIEFAAITVILAVLIASGIYKTKKKPIVIAKK
jgi:VIT1/CCC1 family predicted Fe2+/Mn2+ transporter